MSTIHSFIFFFFTIRPISQLNLTDRRECGLKTLASLRLWSTCARIAVTRPFSFIILPVYSRKSLQNADSRWGRGPRGNSRGIEKGFYLAPLLLLHSQVKKKTRFDAWILRRVKLKTRARTARFFLFFFSDWTCLLEQHRCSAVIITLQRVKNIIFSFLLFIIHIRAREKNILNFINFEENFNNKHHWIV